MSHGGSVTGDAAHPEEEEAIKVAENGPGDGDDACEVIKAAIYTLVQNIDHRKKWENRDAGHEGRIRTLEDALAKLTSLYTLHCVRFGDEKDSAEEFIKGIPPR